jgi:2-oxoisovalerate dehydrogenase E1 component
MNRTVHRSIEPPPGGGRAKKFNLNRAQVVDQNFVEFVRNWVAQGFSPGEHNRTGEFESPTSKEVGHPKEVGHSSELTGQDLIELFESQIIARHQDIVSREMRSRNVGFYTIASAGHEGNAVVGRLTRHTDIAFVHYRSGAFMAERARKVSGVDFVKDTMLGFAASSDDPIAGGRHKAWGSVPMWVPPQTSTIASHLPKAVGTALSLHRAKRLGVPNELPADSIVVCSFGDATTNHAVAQTAFNSAGWAAYQRLPVPILFVCEDNSIGISVETPDGWIEETYRNRCGLHYLQANGLDLIDAYTVTKEAVERCREQRCPVFLHLKVVRLLGHAGSDAETEYHTLEQIEAAETKDPLLASAELLLREGLMTADDVLELYERIRSRVRAAAEYASQRPKLTSAAEVMAPLAPSTPDKVAAEARRPPDHAERVRIFKGEAQLPEKLPSRHMAALINHGLHDLLIKYPESILFGEDVAKKGGVYHVTTGLTAAFGLGRVFNTLLDETTILGLAIGSGHVGLLPIPEIQYLAYYHNAEDQIRSEACSLQFFSKDQYRNPMVIRIAGWGYQKGFGGHFHNDNSIAALRDVPSLIIATPSRGDDAVKMVRTCLAMAKVDGRVIVFIEPIALYMTKDLYEPKDAKWSFPYPPPSEFIPFGEGAVYPSEPRPSGSGKVGPTEDLTILTFANGVHMSLRAAKTLREKHKIAARVVDLRWLNPLNEAFIIEQAMATKRVLVVDEGRKTGGVSESIMALLCEKCGAAVKLARLTAHDTYIPLGPAAEYVLPEEAAVVRLAIELTTGKRS